MFCPDFPTSQSHSIIYFTKPLNSILQKDGGQSFETFAAVLAVFFHQKPIFEISAYVKKAVLTLAFKVGFCGICQDDFFIVT